MIELDTTTHDWHQIKHSNNWAKTIFIYDRVKRAIPEVRWMMWQPGKDITREAVEQRHVDELKQRWSLR